MLSHTPQPTYAATDTETFSTRTVTGAVVEDQDEGGVPPAVAEGPSRVTLFLSLVRDSIPVILSYILQNSIQTVAILIAGRLSPEALSAAAFSLMLAFVTGECPLSALSENT